ncbi:MAG TPA: Rrf2 family transcriptional regulator [Candidatus Udaeobacter sp.]|jgi:Rrf2 family protein|nr:Rrf2 family transcriptional regulator [Candidatus Udaeobacter sp.]
MKLSKRGEYALRAMIDLAVAAELGRPIVQVSELAAKERLPVKFLEQIFIQLKAGGLVSTTRGKLGGYSLARPAPKIRFGEVVRLIEGPLAPIRCTSVTSYERCTCPDEAHCGLRMLMLDVRNAIARILDRTSLADVVEITLRKLRRDKLISPFQSDPRTALATRTDPFQLLSGNYNSGASSGDTAGNRPATRHNSKPARGAQSPENYRRAT